MKSLSSFRNLRSHHFSPPHLLQSFSFLWATIPGQLVVSKRARSQISTLPYRVIFTCFTKICIIVLRCIFKPGKGNL